jgi:hypothetical protein
MISQEDGSRIGNRYPDNWEVVDYEGETFGQADLRKMQSHQAQRTRHGHL